MSSIPNITTAGQSLQDVWSRVGSKAEELTSAVATGDGSFVQAVVELKALKLQADAARMVFKTLHDMAGELLTQPRK